MRECRFIRYVWAKDTVHACGGGNPLALALARPLRASLRPRAPHPALRTPNCYSNGVATISDDVATLLVRELQACEREIALFPDDESVWRTVPGVTNAAGNLAMHLAGNLQYFIGAVLGETGYVRNRELEFGQRSGTREAV